ncbi:glycerol kinase [Candidatus Marinamargulisbacteria bacterium SCGC AG-343-D04]|nr:glycerol kinase [Candidatus Marinamargulisbacteria bacterium SCGC AG-343-D04]
MILTLDLGTTSNRCLAISSTGQCAASAQQEFKQYFPNPAWVEHDPTEIWTSTLTVLKTVIDQIDIQNVSAIAITNQRETVVAWDKHTGKALHNAIVWQCRRTAERMQDFSKSDQTLIKNKTGLPTDAYFSASKMEWLYNNVDAVKEAALTHSLCFGTIDSWVLFQLTQKKCFTSDPSNASRTLLYNIHSLDYDPDLLTLFNIQREWLPSIKESNACFGYSDPSITTKPIPIHAILGDQQASLFAQCGNDTHTIKNTYGTGLFICASTGKKVIDSPSLVSTIGWHINNKTTYAVEGSIFVGGAAIQWLRDGLELITDASESNDLAQSVKDTHDVYVVPALTGLGAPHWDSSARGLIVGITRGTTKAHIVRATLESLAYQTKDVIETITPFLPGIRCLKVDGGATNNDFLMQFQADITGLTVNKAETSETTAYGVAGLAGISCNIFTEKEFRHMLSTKTCYNPTFKKDKIDVLYTRWKKAVQKSSQWIS